MIVLPELLRDVVLVAVPHPVFSTDVFCVLILYVLDWLSVIPLAAISEPKHATAMPSPVLVAFVTVIDAEAAVSDALLNEPMKYGAATSG